MLDIVMEKSEVRADRISPSSSLPPHTYIYIYTHTAREIADNDDSDTRDYLGTLLYFL